MIKLTAKAQPFTRWSIMPVNTELERVTLRRSCCFSLHAVSVAASRALNLTVDFLAFPVDAINCASFKRTLRLVAHSNNARAKTTLCFVIGGVVVVVAIIAVLTRQKRKRESGKLWMPEGFALSKKQRRDPIGQDDFNLEVLLVSAFESSRVTRFFFFFTRSLLLTSQQSIHVALTGWLLVRPFGINLHFFIAGSERWHLPRAESLGAIGAVSKQPASGTQSCQVLSK